MTKPYVPNDAWSQKAAKEGYRARSVYKLMELDEKFKLLRTGMTVLDLGAAPGSWLQYTAKKIGPKGRTIGLDLTPIESVAENVRTMTVDILDEQAVDAALQRFFVTPIRRPAPPSPGGGRSTSIISSSNETSQTSLTSLTSQASPFDLVLSDIAPSTTGIRDVDQWRSIELNQCVLRVAERWLKPGGRCVLKVFRGADFDAFLAELRRNWAEVKPAHVAASRDRSMEIYLVLRKGPVKV